MLALLAGCGASNSPSEHRDGSTHGGRSACGPRDDPCTVSSAPGLPPHFPSWHYRRFRRVGHGLFVVALAPRGEKTWIVAFDAGGRPIWWLRTRTPILQNQILPNGTVEWARSFRDGYGINPKMADEIHSLSGRLTGLLRTHGTITDGHELQGTPNGDVYLDSFPIHQGVDLRPFGGPRKAAVAFGEVQELSPTGQLLWRWSSRGHIGLAETGRWWQHNVLRNPHLVKGHETYDAVHINSIDPWGHQVVISTRHTDAVFAIDRRSGRILWKLGGTPTPRSLRVIGDPYSPELFGGQHDARRYAHGVLSVYDDSTHRARPPRAAFYRLEPRRGTATFLGQLTDPLVKQSHCCGSVRAFDGGWLVDWGDNPLITDFDAKGRIVFRLHLPTSSYRAVPVPRSISARELRLAMARADAR